MVRRPARAGSPRSDAVVHSKQAKVGQGRRPPQPHLAGRMLLLPASPAPPAALAAPLPAARPYCSWLPPEGLFDRFPCVSAARASCRSGRESKGGEFDGRMRGIVQLQKGPRCVTIAPIPSAQRPAIAQLGLPAALPTRDCLPKAPSACLPPPHECRAPRQVIQTLRPAQLASWLPPASANGSRRHCCSAVSAGCAGRGPSRPRAL